ncbi:hypothetical protein FDECE_16502 [Fusarium decemcellulare]|nr:hypothetical protein FDECE_16502 [Fusarium decemcellulare]
MNSVVKGDTKRLAAGGSGREWRPLATEQSLDDHRSPTWGACGHGTCRPPSKERQPIEPYPRPGHLPQPTQETRKTRWLWFVVMAANAEPTKQCTTANSLPADGLAQSTSAFGPVPVD